MEFGAVAMAPGYGVRWVTLDPDDAEPTALISLRAEQVIHGRLFDVQGRPVPDVEVLVHSIRSDHPQSPARLHDRYIYRRSDGVTYWWIRDARVFPAWPRPVTTDADGRFTVRGVGQNLHAELSVHHPRFALQRIPVETDDNAESKPVTAALAPTQIVNVRVTYADTGEPVPHSPLEVHAGPTVDESETDDAGQARINSWPAQAYYVTAYPPEGHPYLIANGQVDWPKGALEQTRNLVLPRGVLVHGKVTEEGSGKPVPGAHVQFHTGAPNGKEVTMTIRTGSDGSFRLGAEPKPGHLFIRGPNDDFVFQAIGSRVVLEGQPGGGRMYSHAYAALDLKPGMGSQEVNLVVPSRRTTRWKAGSSGRTASPSRRHGSTASSSSNRARGPGWAGGAPTTASAAPYARPFRDRRACPRCRGACLLPRAGAQAGSRCQPLGQVGVGRAEHSPARALRVCPGVARRSRRQAGRETGGRAEDQDSHDPR